MKTSRTEFNFKTHDNLTLYAQAWVPDAPAKGVICLVHGIGEHGGRYAAPAEILNNAGYIVAAFDQRGHGKSEGRRGHTPSYEAWMDDIRIFLEEVKQRFPALKCFLYGQSLGGNQVINYVLRRSPEIAGVIATSPELRLAFRPPAWKVFLGKVMNKIYPGIILATGLNLKDLSHDPHVANAYDEDPLTHDRISARNFVCFMEAGEWAIANAGKLSIPLLLMHGTGDRITSAPASEEFARNAGDLCAFKLWDGFYHELQNEVEKDAVLKYVVGWLDLNI
ncbi:MAG: lysophospholipase [Candidatus Margulisiibacteriota bacterium]